MKKLKEIFTQVAIQLITSFITFVIVALISYL